MYFISVPVIRCVNHPSSERQHKVRPNKVISVVILLKIFNNYSLVDFGTISLFRVSDVKLT
jgi:hypothetical protein